MKLSLSTCIVLLLLTGCGATIIPPAHVLDPVPVFVTDYGRHSSLVLPDGGGDLVEFAFGDWNWFAVNKTGFTSAVSAMLWSGGATFGFRHLDAGPHRANLAGVIGCNHVLRFEAERARVEMLPYRPICRPPRRQNQRLKKHRWLPPSRPNLKSKRVLPPKWRACG